MKKTMTDIDIILELEGGELVIEDNIDWQRVKNLAHSLSYSQGFYGRLYRQMCEFENECMETDGELSFPILMQKFEGANLLFFFT